MDLILPTNQNTSAPVTLDTKVLVVIGANGAGKSSFGRNLHQRYAGQSVWISGMHSLFLSSEENKAPVNGNELTRLQSMIAERLFIPRMSEYEKLILHLQTEEFEAAVQYKEESKLTPDLLPPVTKIDRIQTIWEKMFPHNRLVRKSGFIELASTSIDGDSYTAGRMSDGEKLVFYLIGAVLCAPENALLIIEEPEVLLHDSIKNPLWDEVEAMRPDCTYVYLTHDIDFAASRDNSKRLWIRSYNGDARIWDYELIENNDSFPEEVYMEILGSRKPILFIEGTDSNSIDSRLYPLIFPDYKVKPMGGCQKVIETTKAFAQLKDFHTLDSKGIVDRDRRTEGEIAYLREQHIYVPNVAEVENLLMLEPVIKTVAARLMKDPDYELIENNDSFPEEVYMEILGSRKPILFIEGTDSNSIDSRLYPLIFPDYKVKPMGGCQKVIETTKAFAQLKDFHTLDSKGIVDRDRRTEGEIAYLREQHIYVPNVAEVENLLMLEPVIKTVAARLMKDPEQVFSQVKENVIKLFLKDLESQVLLHARHRVQKKLETALNRKMSTVDELTEHVESIHNTVHVDEIYAGIKEKFIRFAETGDYKNILRVYNQKGMLPQSQLCKYCGISNKESYLNLVLSILKENKEDAIVIRTSIKECLGT